MSGRDADHLRAMIQPVPQPSYPTPWRTAETAPNTQEVVVCYDGSYTAYCPTIEAAEVIVAAVNAFATGLTVEGVRAGCEAAIRTREATPGYPAGGTYPATLEEVADELADFIQSLAQPKLLRMVAERLQG